MAQISKKCNRCDKNITVNAKSGKWYQRTKELERLWESHVKRCSG